MERVIALVNKLQEQIQNNSPLVYLTATAEMLVTELRQKNTATHLGKVSIFHPTILSPIINRVTIGNQPATADPLVNTDALVLNEPQISSTPVYEANPVPVFNSTPNEELESIETTPPTPTATVESQEPEKIVYTLNISEEALLEELPAEAAIATQEVIVAQQEPLTLAESLQDTTAFVSNMNQEGQPSATAPAVEIVNTAAAPTATPEKALPITEKAIPELHVEKKSSNFLQSAFFMDEQFAQIPTLPIQEPKKEFFELAGNFDNEPSINDSLKQHHQQQEVGSTLQETPIKDLRKGIGINDRFIFINELFRGDEAMYERSLKTINNFSIFPEAEFWIKRELKVKLGWDNAADSVKLFDQLVRRRFS